MKRLVQIAIGAFAVAAFAFASGTQAEAKCMKYGASAIAVTQELAKEFAKVNLDFAISFAGAKAKGKTKYACVGPVISECKATQLACK